MVDRYCLFDFGVDVVLGSGSGVVVVEAVMSSERRDEVRGERVMFVVRCGIYIQNLRFEKCVLGCE